MTNLVNGEDGMVEQDVLFPDLLEEVLGDLLGAALDAVLLGPGVAGNQQVHDTSGS